MNVFEFFFAKDAKMKIIDFDRKINYYKILFLIQFLLCCNPHQNYVTPATERSKVPCLLTTMWAQSFMRH
jgi:hypothetical protein